MREHSKKFCKLLVLLLIAVVMVTGVGRISAKAESLPTKRLWGEDRFETAVSISREGWPAGSQYVILATGEGDDKFADALAGTPLAHALGAPILLTETNSLNSFTRTEIKRLKAKFVIILGGQGVVSAKVENELVSSFGLKCERLWGDDRYGTAVKIANKLAELKGKSPGRAYLTTGTEFQYALMIAPFAAKNGTPILFTENDKLNENTSAAINAWGAKGFQVEIIGNTSVVSPRVESMLKVTGAAVTRTEGTDMNDTNVNAALSNSPNPGEIVLARDDLFADALTGAPYAAMKGAPIILVGKDSLSPRLEEYMDSLRSGNESMQITLTALGGPAAISESVLMRARSILDYYISQLRGNTPGNIINGGFVDTRGLWVFYSNCTDNGKLYKMKFDGSEKQKLSDDTAMYINVVGNWIYYSNASDGYKLYKILFDGRGRQRLNDEASYCINVAGDMVYYETGVEPENFDHFGGNIRKIRTDGTGRTELDNSSTWDLSVVDGWVYYTNYDDGSKIYKMRVDGSGKTPVSNDYSWYTVADDEWIYYFDYNSSGLSKIRTDGTGKVSLNNHPAICINPSGDFVYYVNNSDQKIYREKKDGTVNQCLNDRVSEHLHIIGERIYYIGYEGEEYSYERKMYKMRLDGSESSVVDERSGNSAGNINNGSLIAQEGDFIYYRSNLVDGYRIYKMRTDGTGRQRLNNTWTRSLNVLYGWVYYVNEDNGNKIYKMRTDGTLVEPLNNESSMGMTAVGDWIYYVNSNSPNQGGNIIKIRTDGTERTVIDSGMSKHISIVDGWIYFVNCGDNNNVYKMRMDGSGKARVYNEDSSYTAADGDFVYYCANYGDTFSLVKVRNDGSGRVELDTGWILNINPSGDWVYYLSTDAVPNIYRIRKDGSGRQIVSEKWVQNVYILGGSIYYYTHSYDPSGEFLFRMNLDGSGDTQVLGW